MGTATIRLGKIFGLEIGFNWSLVVFFLLIAWTMATSVLPAGAPGQPTATYWAAGFAGALVFYLCLLGHEISHALVARSRGVAVAGITLWLFGGMTQLEGEPARAVDQALITAAGPLTSLVLAGAGLGLALGLTALAAPVLLVTVAGWLALLNLVLAVFNLVPALPLDGGRLLGALIWWRTGSRDRGTRNAVRVGRVLSYGLMGLGAVEVVAGGVVSGIWLGIIGWFLLSAGAGEGRQLALRSGLRQVLVAAAMAQPLVSVPDWLTVGQLLESGTGRRSPIALHDPAGARTGFVALSRVLRQATGGDRDRRLRDFSAPAAGFVQLAPGENLEAALARLGPRLEEGALVVDGEAVVGTLSAPDVARALAALSRPGALLGRTG